VNNCVDDDVDDVDVDDDDVDDDDDDAPMVAPMVRVRV
jgi:hypothetical protein